jgi:hypothetical protein
MRQPHPIANVFHKMTDQEYTDLKADIAENGVRIPIWIYEEQTLDGRHRERACDELGIPCPEMLFTGTHAEAIALTASLNLRRRHYTPGQLDLIGAELATMKHGAAGGFRGNQHVGGKLSKDILADISVAEAAKHVGRSTAQINRAKALKRDATPEVVEQVRTGQIKTVGKALKQTRKAAKPKPAAKAKPAPQPTEPKLSALEKIAVDYGLPADTFSAAHEIRLSIWLSKPGRDAYQKASEFQDMSMQEMLASHIAEHIRPANHKPVPRYDDFNRLKPGEKSLVEMGLTREEIDPDFKGSDFDFHREHGHMRNRTKAQKEFAAAATRGDALVVALKNSLNTMPRQPVTETDILAWIEEGKKMGGRREGKLLERMLAFREVAAWLLPLIEQVEALVGPLGAEKS